MQKMRQVLRGICAAIVLITVINAVFIVIPAYITGAYRWEYSYWQIKNVPPTWDFMEHPPTDFMLLLLLLPLNGLLLHVLIGASIVAVLWQRQCLIRKEKYAWLVALSCCLAFTCSTSSVMSMFIDWLID
ncbi:MAG TPA: hypothetical protein V6C64_00990 [Microcoleaceae cyanobacterium]